MDENVRELAAISLIELAENQSQSDEVRIGIISMIGFLNTAGLVVEDRLHKLKFENQQLELAINETLVGIKSEHSVQIYLDILKEHGPDKYILRDIAELGTNAYNIGPEVVGFLDDIDMDMKLFAARTLGYIGYKPAIPKLIELLNETHDVQLNFVTVESLGMLKAQKAIKPLKRVAKKHWYPPVKEAAKTAIKHIKSGKDYGVKHAYFNFAMNFIGFKRFELDSCEETTLKPVSEPEGQKLYAESDQEKLDSLAYDSVILSYGAGDAEQQLNEDPDGIIEVNSNNMVEYRDEIVEIPQMALRVKDGWLAGSDRGEWGGELVYIPDSGKATIILDENIEDVYKLGERYIATTGLAHMFLNEGMLYQLNKNDQGHWKAKEWLRLPGAPYSSWFVETGELLINTTGGGSILLSEHGELRMATCVK